MAAADLPVGLFVGGLFLVYLALGLVFGVVLQGRAGVPLSRRRHDAVSQSTGLTRLTDNAEGALNRGLKKRPTGFLSRQKLEQAGLNKEPGDYLLMAGAITLVAAVMGYLLGGR